ARHPVKVKVAGSSPVSPARVGPTVERVKRSRKPWRCHSRWEFDSPTHRPGESGMWRAERLGRAWPGDTGGGFDSRTLRLRVPGMLLTASQLVDTPRHDEHLSHPW